MMAGERPVSVLPMRFPSLHQHGRERSSSYQKNVISGLEQMAEDMSQGGSDIGEEIRRMNEESKQRSRQSSLQSSHQGDHWRDGLMRRGSGNSGVEGRTNAYGGNGFVGSPVGSVRSAGGRSNARKASAAGSSRLAQMVEPVQEGRPLDSPPAQPGSLYGTSPPESQPLREASRRSLSPSVVAGEDSRRVSESSFSRTYDQIAGQIEESLEHVPPSPPKQDAHLAPRGSEEDAREGATTPPARPRSIDTYQEAMHAFKDFDGVHFSPDTDEFVELDEQGNEIRRVSARSSNGGLSADAVSLLRTPRSPHTRAEPPPLEGMVYYPAPVPRMLNMPKRLSQLPAELVQTRKRRQVLSQYNPEAMASAPWIPPMSIEGDVESRPRSNGSQHSGSHLDDTRDASGSQNGSLTSHPHPRPYLNERMSTVNFVNLPPQLRASVFFEQQSVQQNVQIKDQSAVATLDSILAASATAPVNAFTDHPYAGDVRRSVFAPEKARARRSTMTLNLDAKAEPDSPDSHKKVKKRRSTLGNLLRRNSSALDLEEKRSRRASRSSTMLDFHEGGKKLQKRRSQMSLGDDIQRNADPIRTPGNEISEPDLASGLIAQAQNSSPRSGDDNEREELDRRSRSASRLGSRPATAMSTSQDHLVDDSAQISADFEEAEAQEDIDDVEPMFVAPSTLLAELQVRKAQQRSRNRTAATAYPNGMHSTLLQLDAVEQINKEKRKRSRIPLAWEDPALRAGEDGEEEDDDVPLGVLYPGKDGLVGGKKKVGDGRDWERPLGLMERRELEDGENLWSRRNRMLGLPAGFGRAVAERQVGQSLGGTVSQLQDVQVEGGEDESGGEEGGETLAQRLRKLKTKEALDTAISDVAARDGERPLSTFTDDVMNQFADPSAQPSSGPGTKGKDVPATAGAEQAPEAEEEEEEEETLGQRRARLQREQEEEDSKPLASLASARPSNGLRSSTSLANLLATNPVGSGNRARSREHVPAQGTLLHASAQQQAKQRQALVDTNLRSGGMYVSGMDRLLVDGHPGSSRAHINAGMGGLMGMQNSAAAMGGFAGGVYNYGLGGVGMQSPQMGAGFAPGGNGYFASPTAGMMYPSNMSLGMQAMGMGHTVYAQQMPGMGYPAPQQMYGTGGPGAMGMGVPAMAAYGGMGYQAGGMGMVDPGLDAKKKESIDRWRMSVLQ